MVTPSSLIFQPSLHWSVAGCFSTGLHDAMMTSLTPDDNPSVWTHLTNMLLLVVVSYKMDVSALFLVIVAVCDGSSVTLALRPVPPSWKTAETTAGFASRELQRLLRLRPI